MKPSLENSDSKFPKGHFIRKWLGLGIAIFSALGLTVCLITESFGLIGVGPAIGVALGFGIGQSLEEKYFKEGRIRPLTEDEKRKHKITERIGIGLLSLGFILFLLFYFGN